MTNAVLTKAADIIDNAWCKGDLRKEQEAQEDGDRYCAVGALAVAVMPEDKLMTLDGEYIGDPEQITKVNNLIHKSNTLRWKPDPTVKDIEDSRQLNQEAFNLLEGTTSTYDMLDEHPLTAALALNILRDPERVVRFTTSDELRDEALAALKISVDVLNDLGWTTSEIVFSFNDHKDTTRDDVVALFREVAEEVDTDE